MVLKYLHPDACSVFSETAMLPEEQGHRRSLSKGDKGTIMEDHNTKLNFIGSGSRTAIIITSSGLIRNSGFRVIMYVTGPMYYYPLVSLICLVLKTCMSSS